MHTFRRSAALLALSACTLAALPALAAEELHYNQISLRAEVSQEVARDLMIVTLYTEEQNTDPAKLAADVSTTMNKALAQAKQVKDITLRQGSRNSYPIYDTKGQKITGWRERAELRLESADFAALSKLTGELLGDLKMGGMDFAIADPTRKASEDQLLKEAVTAFKARAQLATNALGGKDYKLVSLSLNGGGFQAPMPMRMGAMKSMAEADAAPTPEIEAGSSQVSVNADGVIEVLMP